MANAAVTVSATCRNRKDTVNTGSTSVSATKPFRIICLQIGGRSCPLPRSVTDAAKARFISNSCRISSRQGRSEPEILVRLIRELTMRRAWPYQNRPRQLEFAILERGGRRLLQFGHFQPEIQAIPLAISRRSFATSDVETERNDQAFRWPGDRIVPPPKHVFQILQRGISHVNRHGQPIEIADQFVKSARSDETAVRHINYDSGLRLPFSSIDQRTRSAIKPAKGSMSPSMLAWSSAARYALRSSTRTTVQG